MEAQTKWNYLGMAPDTTRAAVVVMDNYFYSDDKLFWTFKICRPTCGCSVCKNSPGVRNAAGVCVSSLSEDWRFGFKLWLYLAVSWLRWPCWHEACCRSAGCGSGRCWQRAFPVLETQTHASQHILYFSVFLWCTMIQLRNLCVTWHTCHHAVGGLLVAIVTWGHWVVQAGWRIAQSRCGQVHMRAFGWLDQWETWVD